MSLRLSRGTYNGGLLSTEAGTLERVVVDGTITLAGLPQRGQAPERDAAALSAHQPGLHRRHAVDVQLALLLAPWRRGVFLVRFRFVFS